ncbi:MAG TPA: ABC transporter permease subunit, partial [Thermomicrobiales bacterium]|nr:ABC transporter permease subunit [Thermomicrobiales bacterium]
MSVQASAKSIAPPGTVTGGGNLAGRQTISRMMTWLLFVATAFAVVALVVLLLSVLTDALPWLRPELVQNMPSRSVEKAGLRPALIGSMWLIGFTALVAFPIGVASAIYLEEYAPNNRWTRFLAVNIQNLAGVPSVVYGLLGLGVFVTLFNLGRSVIAGALTMALLILPVVIIASREAIRAVPPSIREAAYGLGATRWQAT